MDPASKHCRRSSRPTVNNIENLNTDGADCLRLIFPIYPKKGHPKCVQHNLKRGTSSSKIIILFLNRFDGGESLVWKRERTGITIQQLLPTCRDVWFSPGKSCEKLGVSINNIDSDFSRVLWLLPFSQIRFYWRGRQIFFSWIWCCKSTSHVVLCLFTVYTYIGLVV